MIKFLVKLFIKNSEDITNPDVRNNYGQFGGLVGIFLNICLFSGKFIAGLIVNSIAITADAFNNLSDAGSSIITLIGFKMAAKPADNEHPFGHGRFEYISGFVISMVILLMSFELGKTSIQKIFNPTEAAFSIISVSILFVSILVKLWMCFFNRRLGKIIDSPTMKATAMDSLSDVVATSTVVVGIFISYLTKLNIDGYLGIVVAIFIFFTGISTIRETLDKLLGEAPDKELISQIKGTVLEHKEVIGVHDIIVHNYGAGQLIISLHAEVPCDIDILKIHDIIDLIEIELKDKFKCIAVIHMDPIETNDEKTLETAQKVMSILKSIDNSISMHDFRMVVGETHTNLVFDVVIPFKFRLSDEKLKCEIRERISCLRPDFYVIVEIDKEPV